MYVVQRKRPFLRLNPSRLGENIIWDKLFLRHFPLLPISKPNVLFIYLPLQISPSFLLSLIPCFSSHHHPPIFISLSVLLFYCLQQQQHHSVLPNLFPFYPFCTFFNILFSLAPHFLSFFLYSLSFSFCSYHLTLHISIYPPLFRGISFILFILCCGCCNWSRSGMIYLSKCHKSVTQNPKHFSSRPSLSLSQLSLTYNSPSQHFYLFQLVIKSSKNESMTSLWLLLHFKQGSFSKNYYTFLL